jgi:hypothetical protein
MPSAGRGRGASLRSPIASNGEQLLPEANPLAHQFKAQVKRGPVEQTGCIFFALFPFCFFFLFCLFFF